MNFFEELKWRGLIKDTTDEVGIAEKLNTHCTAYLGIDPTADSLHIGHMQQLLLLRRYQKAGHRVIALCGGATGMIGDPRPTTERKLLTIEDVAHNVSCIKTQIGKFVDFEDETKGILVNNYDWTKELSLIDFLRDYGKHFNVAYMINKDTIAKRLESGISFTEFTYTILQAMDFLHLYNKYGCDVQFGGSDQWGNIVSGSDLIKKVHGSDTKVYGVTSPLVTKSDGTKFGKSEGSNIWLDATKTSVYEFYQFWLNVTDEDAIPLLKRMSFRTQEEIESIELSMKENPHLREAQKALASEITELVHGKDALDRALEITEILFKGDIKKLSYEELKAAFKGAPSGEIIDGEPILDALVKLNICKSKNEARKLVEGNSVAVNGDKVNDINYVLNKKDAFNEEITVIKKGKKVFALAQFE
ncbi:MAG: tyrosine--tRNA ligase [Erysipelotrichaceae bacterium]|nr:tyrosine--tRNA ligase [Erysipelotrichaceae bacterium]